MHRAAVIELVALGAGPWVRAGGDTRRRRAAGVLFPLGGGNNNARVVAEGQRPDRWATITTSFPPDTGPSHRRVPLLPLPAFRAVAFMTIVRAGSIGAAFSVKVDSALNARGLRSAWIPGC